MVHQHFVRNQVYLTKMRDRVNYFCLDKSWEYAKIAQENPDKTTKRKMTEDQPEEQNSKILKID